MLPLRLTGYARGSHVEVIATVRDAIESAGGYITDCHLFSNAIVCVNFEMTGEGLRSLEALLAAATVRLDAEAVRELKGRAACADIDRIEASLSVNMIHDDPALRIEVPSVPG